MKKRKKYLEAGFLLGVLFIFTGCGAKPVAEVGTQALYLPELMYYVHQAEAEGEGYEEMYQNIFSESYWDAEYKEGKTFREVAKEEAYENAVRDIIFEKEAEEAGYTLSEAEEEACEKEAAEEFAALTEAQKKAIGLTEREYLALKKRIALGSRYSDALMEGLEINEDKAVSFILEEDYIQYDVEYLYAAEEELLAPYLERAVAGEDFAAIAAEKPEELEAGSLGFLEGDFSLGEHFEKEALQLSVGETSSQLVQEEDGYYIIRMRNDHSTESYEAACEEAVLTARNEAFQEAYEAIKENYEIQKYDSAWDSLVIGTSTLGQEE